LIIIEFWLNGDFKSHIIIRKTKKEHEYDVCNYSQQHRWRNCKKIGTTHSMTKHARTNFGVLLSIPIKMLYKDKEINRDKTEVNNNLAN
jgi:hypothetical protein